MTDMIPPAEMTLDELRPVLAPRIADNVAFDGWSQAALANAAQSLGVPPEVAKLAFSGGAVDMIDGWFQSIDQALETRLPPEHLAKLRIRDRIRTLVLERLALSDKEAARRAVAILAMPQNAARGLRLGWRAADVMWRLAGDTATDFSHYSRRMTLGSVYAATVMIWLNDESDGEAETAAFLDRRIDGVLRFEKAKARLKPDPEKYFSPALFLGRLRYPNA